MKLTFLGTGTSQGVPVIGCRCPVCCSSDPRDRRLRTAAMVEAGEVRLVIDAGPDFRYQMLRTGVRHIDAILLTHEHKDHIGGLDDVRAFNFVDYPVIHRINIYGTERTLKAVRRDFSYAFAAEKYRGVPELELREIDPQSPFRVKGIEVIPVSGRGEFLPQQVVTNTSDTGAYQLLRLQLKLFEDISGVGAALLGRSDVGARGADMLDSQIRMASMALTDIYDTFGAFTEARDAKALG